MTELYDDCNFKNKEKLTVFQIGGAWYNLAYMDMERKAMRELTEKNHANLWDTPGVQFAQMQDELCTCNNQSKL